MRLRNACSVSGFNFSKPSSGSLTKWNTRSAAQENFLGLCEELEGFLGRLIDAEGAGWQDDVIRRQFLLRGLLSGGICTGAADADAFHMLLKDAGFYPEVVLNGFGEVVEGQRVELRSQGDNLWAISFLPSP